MHRSVKEILERLEFDCPGCKTSLRYQEMFTHVKSCAEIKSVNRVDQSQLIKIVAQNTGEAQAIQEIKPKLGQYGNGPIGPEIYVLDRDTFNVFIYTCKNQKVVKQQVIYESTDGNISWNKAGNTQMLPHNFQCVQLGNPA